MTKTKIRSDFDFGPYEDEYRGFGDQDEQTRGPLILVLALGVLLIFAGVVWNTYRQGVRPTEGGLPVIADASPEFKRAPDERGGTEVAGLDRGFYDLMETANERLQPADELDGGVQEAPEAMSVEEAEPPARPEPRIAALVPERSNAVEDLVEEAARLSPAPTTLFASDGAFQVQLMALRSEDAAQKAWSEFNRQFPTLAAEAQVDIQRADLGARGTFYRLRLGQFGSRDDARTYCDELKSNGRDCIVVSRPS